MGCTLSEVHARDDGEIHWLLIENAGMTASDEVLDVACGPGLVECEIAKVAGHVTDIDLTPAMIEQARERQRSLGLTRTYQPDPDYRRRLVTDVPPPLLHPRRHPLFIPSLH